MATIAEVAVAMRAVLTTSADAAAEATDFVRRRSKLSGARFAQTLVFGWLADSEASLEGLCRTAAALGVPISPQGLDQRLTREAAACLRAVLEAAAGTVVAAEPAAVRILARFTAVWVQDSTVLALPAALAAAWPGCGNATTPAEQSAALKAQVRLDLRRGALGGPLLHPGRDHDRAAPPQAPPESGSLRVADLGYYSLAEFRALGAVGAYWLSRLQVQAAVFDAGRRRDVLALLTATAGPEADLAVTLGVDERLPARLLAVPVPPAVAAERWRKLRAEARRRGQAVSKRRLAWADWTILVTNVPPALLTVREALVLARARWQIELLFKLWKSHGRIDQSRSAKPERILCEVYAKLTAMVVQHWLLLLGCWARPDRSLTKAARAVRQLALHLAVAIDAPARLRAALADLQRGLATGCRISTRRAPATYQLLLALTDDPADDHLAEPARRGLAA